MSKPESVILVYKKEHLRQVSRGRYGRIYFGSETCAFLLPSASDIEKLSVIRKKMGIEFSVVTPYITQGDLASVDNLLNYVNKRFPFTEIVVNDWGVLNLIRTKYADLRMVLGRILSKQSRGPLLIEPKAGHPVPVANMRWTDDDIMYFKSSIIQNKYAMQFLKSSGVERFGLDNQKPGFLLDHDNINDEQIDLYYPYSYLTSSPYCLTRAISRKPFVFQRTTRCGKNCLKKRAARVNLFGEVVYVLCNSQMYFNGNVEASLFRKIGRLIKVVI
ncbi:MAG: hypothetical protein Q8O22_01830 [Candidatus Omnitrophota bacterium]|nr:hypothetical protein [Candidatus Omnitrophota bacterium]